MQSILNRGAASMKISARPDSSHRIVPILSPRIVKKSKFKKASNKVSMLVRSDEYHFIQRYRA